MMVGVNGLPKNTSLSFGHATGPWAIYPIKVGWISVSAGATVALVTTLFTVSRMSPVLTHVSCICAVLSVVPPS